MAERQIAIRLPDHVFNALKSRADQLSTSPTSIARQLLIDSLNNEASEDRLAEIIVSRMDKRMADFAQKLAAIYRQKSGG